MLNKKELGTLCCAYAALATGRKLASDIVFELEDLIKKQIIARQPLINDKFEFKEVKNLLTEGHIKIMKNFQRKVTG